MTDTPPVTILTGAAGGIVSATARRLAATGHRLVLTDLDAGRLAGLVAELEAGGTSVAADRVASERM